jgi:glycerol-3-phosphate acyltransferase PlsX
MVDGAVAASRHLDAEILLVGAADRVEAALVPHGSSGRRRVRIVDAPDVVAMTDAPAAALRRKPGASIRVAAECVARGDAAALVSAGHTGASVMAAYSAFGSLVGVDRPALATTIPTRRSPAVLLDAGASVECRPQHLLQFAVMGAVYARVALGVARPRVGLLSIGEEANKGNELTRDAHRLLKQAPVNFVGNVEGREIYSGVADVIVCDGFTGNIVLKTSEGLVETVESLLGDELQGTFSSQVGYLLSRRAFRRFRRRVDYSEFGGALLLGVAGLAIVCHGRSSAKAVRNAIAMAYRFASSDFLQRVEREIAAAAVS